MSSTAPGRGGEIALELLTAAKRRLDAARAQEQIAADNAESARSLEESARAALDAAASHRRASEAALRRARGEVEAATHFLRLRKAEEASAAAGNDRDIAGLTEASTAADDDGGEVRAAGQYEFAYRGKLWCIPESFAFPNEVTRRQAWEMWLRGYVYRHGEQKWRIKPFREFRGSDLHSQELKNVYKQAWKPILAKMMQAPGLDLPDDAEDINDALVQSSYDVATEYLKELYSFIFREVEERGGHNKKAHEGWRISTWSSQIKPSMVRKNGTAADIAKLPPPLGYNRPRPAKRKVAADQQGGKGRKRNDATTEEENAAADEGAESSGNAESSSVRPAPWHKTASL